MRKAIIIMMVLILLVAPIVTAQAVATGVTVVAAVCFAALAGWGVATVANGMTAPDLDAWMVEELGLWGSQQGASYQTLIPESGISVNAYGDFVLDPAASLGVAQFSAWLVDKYGVEAGQGNTPIISSNTYDGQPITFISNANSSTARYWSNAYLLAGSYTGATSQAVRASHDDNARTYICVVDNHLVGISSLQSTGIRVSTMPSYVTGAKVTNLLYMYQLYQHSIRDANNTLWYYQVDTNTISRYSATGSVLCPTFGTVQEAVNAIDGGSTASLEMVADTNIRIPDDSEAAQDTTITWGGATGMTVQRAADHIMTKVENNTLTVVIEGAADDNPTTGWPDVDRPVGVSGLEEIFPFCIPFDVVALVQALDAEPQAPVVHWPIKVDGIIDTTIDLDFSQFDSLAQIVRTLELLAFIVGLAIATRALFIRG